MDERIRRGTSPSSLLLIVVSIAAMALCGCAKPSPTTRPAVWLFGADAPPFDPGGPPDAQRWSIERLLSYGLFAFDSTGAVVPRAVQSVELSADSLQYTLHLRPELRFVDGTPCGSSDFAAALTGPLSRTDHSTRAWQLAAVRGVDQIRPGRPLPEIGIEATDERTLTLRLAVRDPDLIAKLAIPGTSSPWKRRDGGTWDGAIGIGPMRAAFVDSTRRMVLVAGPDTLIVRFVGVLSRARSLLRASQPDLMWPLPSGLLGERMPEGYTVSSRTAKPARRLMLVQRADLPPVTRLAARAALAHGINRNEVVRALGPEGREVRQWIDGASPFEFPRLDPGEIEAWRQRGKLGRSFHVEMAYEDRGPFPAVARMMQGEWAAHDVYVELKPVRGRRRSTEWLTGRSHLVLTEWQDLLPEPSGVVAPAVMPLRGPAIGAVRTGWRTREFDRWSRPSGRTVPFDPEYVQRRFADERILLPLADLPWVWVERVEGPAATCDPWLGPSCPVPLRNSTHPSR
jgi:hypothetical protein